MNIRRLLAAVILLLVVAAFNAFAPRREPGDVAAASKENSSTPLLTAQPPIVVPGGAGKYDWMTIDPEKRRLLAAHPGTGTLVVADLDGNAPLKQVNTGAAQGVAVDSPDGKYFVGGTDNQLVTIIDSQTLAKTGEIKVTGPVDAMVFEPKRRMVYADHDDGMDVWVIDAKADKIAMTMSIAGAPEEIHYDPVTDRLYQNIKTTNAVQVIDPATHTVTATWSTAPATGPHGLAVDGKAHRLFSAGHNGKLVAIDTRTGKVLGSADIEPGVDQIGIDPALKRIYCACGSGAISVVGETAHGVALLGDVPVTPGTHTLAVDPKTHAVWISYVDAQNSYIQQYLVPSAR
jgi:DNA-binding beta-propeller fold protein YncE